MEPGIPVGAIVYDKNFTGSEAMEALVGMLKPKDTDSVYRLLCQHLIEIDEVRSVAQQKASVTYQRIIQTV
jgi:hypothetical protein